MSFTNVPSRRRVLLGFTGGALTALAGCGFRPLHGRDNGNTPASLAAIYVAPIPDRTGQILRNGLLDRLTPKGVPKRPSYQLRVGLREGKQDLAIRKDDVATRANLVVVAQFQLIRASDATVIYTGTATSTNSYNILRSDFATISAENDARRRATVQIADEIRTQLAIFLGGGE